jgi:hypothetical protein
MHEPRPRYSEENISEMGRTVDDISEAISIGDFRGVNSIAMSQTLLEPVAIVEHMNVRRRAAEYPGEFRNWADGLYNYLFALEGVELPEADRGVIDEIMTGLQTEARIAALDTPDYIEVAEDSNTGDNNNWRSSFFVITMERDEFERTLNLPVFEQAKEYILGHDPRHSIADGYQLVERYSYGKSQGNMRLLLDGVISHKAEQLASEPLYGHGNGLNMALDLIDALGSSAGAKAKMRACLDKHVFDLASAYTQEQVRGLSYSQGANLVVEYGSSRKRQIDMLKELRKLRK